MSHTPEPWYLDAFGVYLCADDEDGDAFVVMSASKNVLVGEWEDNIRRALACVNACAGIPTEELEGDFVRELVSIASAASVILTAYRPDSKVAAVLDVVLDKILPRNFHERVENGD